MKQSESWSYIELMKRTIQYEIPYLFQLKKEGFIGNMTEFGAEMVETLIVLEEITEKMKMYFDNLEPVKREYF
jgi:hypothetical protein